MVLFLKTKPSTTSLKFIISRKECQLKALRQQRREDLCPILKEKKELERNFKRLSDQPVAKLKLKGRLLLSRDISFKLCLEPRAVRKKRLQELKQNLRDLQEIEPLVVRAKEYHAHRYHQLKYQQDCQGFSKYQKQSPPMCRVWMN